MTPEQQILQRNKEVFALAEKLYGVDMSKVQVRFDLKGRSAGQARRQHGTYTVRYNRDMLHREAFDAMYKDVVPHEIAHIVCFMRRELGDNHDHGWARVDRSLGGTGARTHNEDVVYGKGLTYEYTTTRGHQVRVSQQIHSKVQAGRVFTYRQGKDAINATCAHSIVGQGGRTLSTPVVKKAVSDLPANHPAVIERHVRQWSIAEVRAVVQTAIQDAKITVPKAPAFNAGVSKASIARGVMLSGHTAGRSYEEIIGAIMHATGHDRQLSRSYYKGNYAKVGCPAPQ